MPVTKAEFQRRIRTFAETFRRNRLRATHQRREVFKELAGGEEHPDVETICDRVRPRVPASSRDTVYRTLATLECEGLIRRADVAGGPARFDANTERHHHFVCSVCGAIKDFRGEALDHLPIPRSVKAFGSIRSAQVQVRGVCSACSGGKPRGR